MKRVAAGFLWTVLATLTLPGCNMACAARDIANALSAQEKPAEPQKPSILLRITPQVAHAPAEVRITVLVSDPGHSLRCPSFELLHGDGSVSGREQECPPADEFQDAYALNVKNHTYREGGEFVVEVRVLVDGKVALVESTRLLIIAPDDDPNSRTASR